MEKESELQREAMKGLAFVDRLVEFGGDDEEGNVQQLGQKPAGWASQTKSAATSGARKI